MGVCLQDFSAVGLRQMLPIQTIRILVKIYTPQKRLLHIFGAKREVIAPQKRTFFSKFSATRDQIIVQDMLIEG